MSTERMYTLYGYEANPRTRIIRIVAAAEGIALTLSEVVPRKNINRDAYIERFPLSQGKIPAIEGENIKINETVAIATYFAKVNNLRNLMGDGSLKQEAEILSWVSWSNQELLQLLSRWFLPLIPTFTRAAPYNYDEIEIGKAASLAVLNDLERWIQARNTKYLVSNHITLADIFLAIVISRGLQWILEPTWRTEHPVTMNYWRSVTEWEFVKEIIPSFELCQKPLPNVDPSKLKNGS